jgi:Hydroxymethylglutaryl-coenzyme A reductase
MTTAAPLAPRLSSTLHQQRRAHPTMTEFCALSHAESVLFADRCLPDRSANNGAHAANGLIAMFIATGQDVDD